MLFLTGNSASQLGKYKIKQWGPLSHVQAAVRYNAERMGIDSKTILGYWPFWEEGGTVAHVLGTSAYRNGSISGAVWKNNKLQFNNDADIVTVYNFPDSGPYTCIAQVVLDNISSDQVIYQLKTNDATNHFLYMDTGGAEQGYRLYDSGFGSTSVDVGGAKANVEQSLCGLFDGGNYVIYTDGIFVDSASVSDRYGSNTIYLGDSDGDGSGKVLYGNLRSLLFLDYGVDEETVELFRERPYILLTRPWVTPPIIFDVGAGTQVTVTDTATGTDSIANISNKLKVSDSGQGQDTFGDILASMTVTDSGQGTDTVLGPSVNLTVSDTATGADAVSQILNSLLVQDSGQGTDAVAQILASLILSDVAAGADSISVDTGGTAKLVTDSGVGSDAVSVPNVSLTVSDSATAQDVIAGILAQLTISDTGTATDAINVLKTKLVQIQDSGVGTDQIGNISVSLTVSDVGQATDVIGQILNSLKVSDTAQGVENVIATNIDLLPKGRVRVTFTVRAPGIDFSGKSPNTKFQ